MTEFRKNKVGTSAIAIVGVAGMFPGSTDSEGFWRDIFAGKDLMTDVPPTHWLPEDYFDADPRAIDKTYARRGAFLQPVDFDTLKFGLPPTNLNATDTSQLLSLIVAQRVFDEATSNLRSAIDLERVSVIIGVTSAQELYGQMVSRMQRPVWVKAMRESGLNEDDVQAISDRISAHYVPWQESTFPGLLGNVVAGRIANRLDLGGTNCVTDAACASSFSAVSMAVNELQIGQSDMVIVGGADTMNDILMYMCFAKTPALSEKGDCRPFSAAADGTMLGEGIGMVALRRLDDAKRDGNRIYAVLRGVGTSSDGRATSVYAPVPAGQAKALRRAYEAAGYSPDTVELVEAHGTGTRAGDAAEAKALKTVFAEASDERQYCALGSVKSQMGHAKAASGAAGLFKAVMALHHRVLPPTIKVDRPNPDLGLDDSAFYLNTETRPWIRGAAHPRRAGVSSFGFGGSNFHLALEQYDGDRAPRLRAFDYELIVLSADSQEQLLAAVRNLIANQDPGLLQRAAYDSAALFKAAAEFRLAVVAADDEELKTKLAKASQMIEARPDEAFSMANGIDYGIGAPEGEIAFLFPGQGSQYLNMGRGLALHFDDALNVWDQAADLDFGVRERLHEVVFPRPVFDDAERMKLLERLTKTEWAQPGIGCVSLSMLSLLAQMGVKPSVVGGHSFGDVTALHVAGVLSAEDLVFVARKRGEVMDTAAKTPGSMIAVLLPVVEVRELIDRLKLDVVVANHNAPSQVVLSGATEAIVEAKAKLRGEGIRATQLRVATAFHSPIVSDSVGPFFEFLKTVDFGQPRISAYANATAAPYPADADEARRCLADQIASPVRFVEQIEAMYASGVRTFIEVGPSSVLTSLVAQILDGQPHRAISLDRKDEAGLRSFLIGISKMAATGLDLDLSFLWQDYRKPAAVSDRANSAALVSLQGPNHGNLYPPPGGFDALPKPNHGGAGIGDRRVCETPPRTVVEPVSAASEKMWLDAFEESQRQTAVAHTAFQKAMTAAHSAFLKSSEASLRSLAAAFGGTDFAVGSSVLNVDFVMPEMLDLHACEVPSVVIAQESTVPAPPVPAQIPEVRPAIDVAALLMAVVADKTGYPIEMLNLGMDLEADLGIDSIKRVEILSAMIERVPELPEIAASQMVDLRTLSEIVTVMSAGLPAIAASVVKPGADVAQILLDVVADKTGYPIAMLRLDMDLEADLGIDSIKRVEILSAMVERAPHLPEVDASVMVSLRTLSQIVATLSGAISGAMSGAMSGAISETQALVAEQPAAPSIDVAALLVEVVAEKTGYPVEMLNLDMDLEGDLGIDSIKRVEILSAMVERVPELPEVEASEMVNLRTLADIVAYMEIGQDQSLLVVAEADNEANSDRTPVGLGRFALDVVDAPALGMAQAGLFKGGLIAVTDDHSGIAAALVATLEERGVKSRVVSEVPEDADGVVFLGGLRNLSMAEEAIEINREAFRIARDFAPHARLFVTVQDTGGCFAVGGVEPARAYLGGLSALAKTAAQEWPDASIKAIDLERGGRSPEDIARALANELISGGPELEVGLSSDGRRTNLRSVRRSVNPGEPSVDASSFLVVSGGARGVTAATMIALARAARPRLLLLGRTKLADEPASCAGIEDEAELRRLLLGEAKQQGLALTPVELNRRLRQILAGREIRSNCRTLESVGAEVHYSSVDVTDKAAVVVALAEVRNAWGPITGLIHGAGLIADRLIADKSDADFDRVFDAKVEGLRNLLAATAEDPLRVICLFSSIAARTGNPGQSDYSMANEVLNKIASAERQQRGTTCLVKSLGWGPWDGGMVTKDIGARFEARGVPLLPIETGEKMLVDELCGGSPDEVEIVLGAEPWAVPGGGRNGDFAMNLVVNRQSHPYLQAHAINGTPVVPVVLAVEWFARVARALRPDLKMACLHDLKVLKGVRLEGFNDGGDRLVLRGSSRANEAGVSLEMVVEAHNGTRHYSATVELVTRRGLPTIEFPDLNLPEWENQPVYGGVLFHGPEFQVISAVNGISDEGVSATLKGIRESRWSTETWRTDAASFDGGLQLALLWSERVLGGASLPTRIDEVRTWTDDLPDGPVQCVLRGREAANGRTLSDVLFQSETGQLVAELVGVETHALPSGF